MANSTLNHPYSFFGHGNLPAGSDFNNCTDAGAWLLLGGNAYVNSPVSDGNLWGLLLVLKSSTTSEYTFQIVLRSQGRVYYRYYAASWSGWYQFTLTAI